ncbi:hypothetical protein PV326_004426 [Microctonus aethiopoides]|nr:hypothetical protein PV326_004426 [Microctonus aethiopoides]
MYFQINITPKAKEMAKECKDESDPPAILVLGPFQPQTRLKFETNLYEEASTKLIIKNPTNRVSHVNITKRPPDDRCILFSHSQVTISPNSESILTLMWTPNKIGSWRDTLQLTDNRRIKYDVALTFICNEGQKGGTKYVTRSRVLTQSNEIHNVYVESKKVSQPSKVTMNKQNMNQILNVESENKENFENVSNNFIKCDNVKTPPRQIHTVDSKTVTVNNFNVSNFQLTPLNLCHNAKSIQVPQVRIIDATPNCSIAYDIAQSNNILEMCDSTTERKSEADFLPVNESLSPKNIENGPLLRRETYFNPEPKFCQHMVSIDEHFDDSLTPELFTTARESTDERDFSMVLNDIVNFTTPLKNISPAACSTGHKSDTASQRFSEENTPSIGANTTFDIVMNNSEKSKLGNVRDVNKSPKSTQVTGLIRPSRLTSTFAKMSPNALFADIPKINSSLSPGPTVDHRRISLRSDDHSSVKAIIEADLWAKDAEPQQTSLLRTNQENINDTLDMITEETVTVTKKITIQASSRNAEKYVTTLRKSSKFCVEISPPKKLITKTGRVQKKISPIKHNKVTKDKNSLLRKKVQASNTSTKQRTNQSIPGVRITKLCLTNLNVTSAVNKSTNNISGNAAVSRNDSKYHRDIKMLDSNCATSTIRNRDPFAATMTHDPFLTHSLYYGDEWILHQETEFTKWLNALLTPPEHSADVETACVDVGKVWQSCRSKENVALAETKETVSARYHNTNEKLNTLRKAACAMFMRDEVRNILAQVIACIEKGIFVIRQDRDLHRDIGLQKAILELLLSYNPLWLRIGLEVIYGETISLSSNNDLIGLTRFLITRFFSDPYLVQTYSHSNVISLKLPAFQLHMNKFLLKKFLSIVYFLDYAKRNKLIGHDPCLFHKKAINKDSRAILLTFSREVLSGVGDITKILRTHGYVVSHKQTYLDEYNYAVKDISSDLRDGVRLCRVMELIIGDRTLTSQCRVPSISRLQKIHNADLALKALIKAGYQITGDIDAKSIVDGHREKTLSLLWQIIYKFQRPRFEKSAIIIQKWWRAKLWYVRVKNYLSRHHNNAACVIQRSWRCYRAKKLALMMREARALRLEAMEKSVRIIQSHWMHRRKMLHDRNNFMQMKAAVIRIQKWFRQIRISRPYLIDLQNKRQAVIILQCRWRATIIMRRERMAFENIKHATMIIQRWWRATSLKCATQNYYQNLRATVIFIQSKWRAQRQMIINRNCYKKTHDAIVKIQIWWRNAIITKRLHNNYILQKNAAKVIKSWWIYVKLMQIERERFLNIRNSTIIIQKCWRKYRDTKNYISSFNSCRKATITIQTWWRSVKHAREYRVKRNSAITIQKWWRGLIITRTTASTFALMRNSAINIQKTWKMKQARRNYLKLKHATQIIQMHYRNTRKMRILYRDFIIKKNATLYIQSWWRNLQRTRECQRKYLTYRKAVVLIQTRWREKILSKSTRQEYLKLKTIVIKIQSYWRMIVIRRVFLCKLKQHKAAIVLQRRWRAKKIGCKIHENYKKHKAAAILIQRKYRATKLAHSTRTQFLNTRNAAIIIQKNWRMYKATVDYHKLKTATIIIQTQWRAQKLAITTRKTFVTLRNSVITIQRFYRAYRIGKTIRNKYLMINQAILYIQRAYRARKLMQECRKKYLEYRDAVICIQSTWRMIQARREYCSKIHATLIIQRTWRRFIIARNTRNKFLAIRASTIIIQRRYRLNKMCKEIHENYNELRSRVIWIQRRWRMIQSRKKLSIEYKDKMKRNNAAIIIQAIWRGYKVRTAQSVEIQELRKRSKKAAEAATPSTTVEYRLKVAMNLLQNFTNIGQLSMCLACIDTLTRLSPKGCILFCELQLVERLYLILEKSNRSLPWMDVCKRCTNILITLAKLPETAKHVRNIDEMEIIARLMNTAIKYDVDLFLHLATLFWLLLNDPEFLLEVKNSERTVWLLRQLIVSVMKKENITMKMKNNKTISAASQSILLPNTKPDWGLKTRRPRCFTTIQQAISIFMDKLDIIPIS